MHILNTVLKIHILTTLNSADQHEGSHATCCGRGLGQAGVENLPGAWEFCIRASSWRGDGRRHMEGARRVLRRAQGARTERRVGDMSKGAKRGRGSRYYLIMIIS